MGVAEHWNRDHLMCVYALYEQDVDLDFILTADLTSLQSDSRGSTEELLQIPGRKEKSHQESLNEFHAALLLFLCVCLQIFLSPVLLFDSEWGVIRRYLHPGHSVTCSLCAHTAPSFWAVTLDCIMLLYQVFLLFCWPLCEQIAVTVKCVRRWENNYIVSDFASNVMMKPASTVSDAQGYNSKCIQYIDNICLQKWSSIVYRVYTLYCFISIL